MNVKDSVQNEVIEMIQHPDYKIEIVEVLRSNFSPKIKQDRIPAYHENFEFVGNIDFAYV